MSLPTPSWSGKRAATVSVVSLLLILAGSDATALDDDAGSGGDAGQTRAEALPLGSFGSFAGHLGANDADWYSVASSYNAPSCITLRASGAGAMNLHLTLERGSTYRNVSASSSADEITRLSVAAPSIDRTAWMLADPDQTSAQGDPFAPGNYSFSVSRLGVPAFSAGDAMTGVDAGSSIASALGVTASCVGGSLLAVSAGDASDYYSIQVPEGNYVQYSLATTGGDSGVSLRLFDASGNEVGLPADNARTSVAGPLPGGTYYLGMGGASLSDTGYLMGIVIGPDPPSNGCRPNC